MTAAGTALLPALVGRIRDVHGKKLRYVGVGRLQGLAIRKAKVLALVGELRQGAHGSTVAIALGAGRRDLATYGGGNTFNGFEAHGLDDTQEDLYEFIIRVVIEGQGRREPRRQARVGTEEVLHLVVIPRNDNNEIITVILHGLHQCFDGLGTEVTAPWTLGGERVGLIDEEDTAQGLIDLLLSHLGGMPHVLAHQILPRHLDHLAGTQ